MSTPVEFSRVDVREVPPQQRHDKVIRAFESLSIGEGIQLVSDQDTLPLRQQLSVRARNQFTWTLFESGPRLWRVEVLKTLDRTSADERNSCCSGGACAG